MRNPTGVQRHLTKTITQRAATFTVAARHQAVQHELKTFTHYSDAGISSQRHGAFGTQDLMAQSQSQSGKSSEERAMTLNSDDTPKQCVSVWAIGGQLGVAVGDGQSVRVPNPEGREPTRDEIYQALVAAGHEARADELADKAYGDVMGTDTEGR